MAPFQRYAEICRADAVAYPQLMALACMSLGNPVAEQQAIQSSGPPRSTGPHLYLPRFGGNACADAIGTVRGGQGDGARFEGRAASRGPADHGIDG